MRRFLAWLILVVKINSNYFLEEEKRSSTFILLVLHSCIHQKSFPYLLVLSFLIKIGWIKKTELINEIYVIHQQHMTLSHKKKKKKKKKIHQMFTLRKDQDIRLKDFIKSKTRDIYYCLTKEKERDRDKIPKLIMMCVRETF